MRTTFSYTLNIFNANFIPLFMEHSSKRRVTVSGQSIQDMEKMQRVQ